MKLISLQMLLMKLLDVGPEAAELIELFIKAKSKNGPGGKELTDAEKADLTAALKELIEDLA